MHKLLFVGGASPIGYELAFALKKKITTSCLSIVDIEISDKRIKKNNGSPFTNFESFVKNKNEVIYDNIIINLYELLDRQSISYYQNNNHIILSVLNKCIDLIQKNSTVKISLLLHSYQYLFEDDDYQRNFNTYNAFILDFMNLIHKIDSTVLQLFFLPNILYEGDIGQFSNTLLTHIKRGKDIVIQDDSRDYLLVSDTIPYIVKEIISGKDCIYEYTSGNKISNIDFYNEFKGNLYKETNISIVQPRYRLQCRDWLKDNKEVNKIVISKPLRFMIREYIKINNKSL